MSADWKLSFRPAEALPPLAWLARVSHPTIEVDCGLSVQRTERAFFEGSWVGDAGLDAILRSTTVFGSGMVVTDAGAHVVTHGHPLEGVYVRRQRDVTMVSNSLVAVLTAARLELIGGVDYPARFARISDGIGNSPIEIPTSGEPVLLYFFDNVHVAADGAVSAVPKPRERPFATYTEYVARLGDALSSVIANAPDYRPIVSVSSGYDSTAVAVIAAQRGCRTAATFPTSREPSGGGDASDSGEHTARRLSMSVTTYNRLAYQSRTDLPEAEFLATGMNGEDVVMLAMEPDLTRSMLVTGMVGGALWRYGRSPRADLWRADLSGCSLTEYRLRVDFLHVALPVFGMTELPSVHAIAETPEMKQYSVPGFYNQPVPRRIAEEAGIPRGTFATVKRAATSVIHLAGAAALAPTTRASVEDFAAAEGERFHLPPRPRLKRRGRLLIHLGRRLRLPFLARRQEEHRHSLSHFTAEPGSLLVRWAVARLRPRYALFRRAEEEQH